MIPLRLTVRNFLSYGETPQTIDFVPYHLICLSGKNGHGKSALLDAMTWAIWGHARKIGGIAKADQGLVRLGQKSMSVAFDFSFNNSVYRIKREFTLTSGKAFVWLEFGLLDTETNTVITLNEKSITQTQRKIEKLLGLDYEAFTNSSFLRQGNSNEFSKKSAKERKEILCAILGLSQYEDIKKRASEKMREVAASLQATMAIQQRLKDQLQQHTSTEHQQELEIVLVSSQELHNKVESLSKEYQQQSVSWQSLLSQQLVLESQLQQLTSLYKEQWQQCAQLRLRRSTLRTQLLLNSEDERVKRLLMAERDLQASELVRQRYEVLTVQLPKVQEQLRQTESAMQLAMQIQQLQAVQLQLQVAIAAIDLQCHESDKLQHQFLQGKEGYARFVAMGNQTSNEVAKLQQQISVLQGLNDNSVCPLCAQSLSEQAHTHLFVSLQAAQQKLSRRVQRIAALLARTKERLAQQHNKIQELQKLLQERERLHAQCEQSQIQEKQLQQQLAQLGIVETVAQLQDKVQALKQEIMQMQSDPAMAYNPAHNASLQQLVLQMRARSEHTDDSAGMRATLREITSTIFSTIAAARATKQSLMLVQAQLMPIQQRTVVQEQLRQQEMVVRTMEVQYKQACEKVTQLQATIDAQQKIRQQLQTEHDQHQKILATLEAQLQDYKIIVQALSKDGIQALLIEQAIPEIESEANKILSRLTDNSAQIMIESVRDLKTGGTKETLDIKISDAVGIRPYEMFSGGEAFRIDFALRIAIAKMLARRAGTCLQTLIIDEGFGSQDDDGLSHMMDAIYAIMDDFAKIIIVSHLPAMKDSFPVHFVVSKGTGGSTISVMEQG